MPSTNATVCSEGHLLVMDEASRLHMHPESVIAYQGFLTVAQRNRIADVLAALQSAFYGR